MKKRIKVFLGLLLCITFVLLSSSCQYIDFFNNQADNENNEQSSIVPDGYTGGMSHDLTFHYEYAVYWLETYEEVLSAIELLKFNGSTISRSIAFNYDGDFFDIKYCFIYQRSKAEPLEDGENFFNRKIDGGEFRWYAFCDDVEISDFMYHKTVSRYDIMWIDYADESWIYRDFENVKDTDDLSFDWFGKNGEYNTTITEYPDYGYYDILYNDNLYCHLRFSETWIPIEYHSDFLSTFVIIE